MKLNDLFMISKKKKKSSPCLLFRQQPFWFVFYFHFEAVTVF